MDLWWKYSGIKLWWYLHNLVNMLKSTLSGWIFWYIDSIWMNLLLMYKELLNNFLKISIVLFMVFIQFSSVAQLCPTLCNPMNCSTPGLPVHHQLSGSTQIHVHWFVMPSIHLILCRPLLLLPSIFPTIRVFSNESVLSTRGSKYWSFSFNISPSNEHRTDLL